MIPIKLREMYGLIPGQEYDFYVMEENGRKYVCIDCGAVVEPVSLDEAIGIVERHGLKVNSD